MKRFAIWLGAALAFAALPAAAQDGAGKDWPTRPVRIVVPFGPGSTPDIVARLIGEQLQQRLGQPFVVENKAGASGNIGTDAVAKAEPDGTTIGVSIGGPLAINTLLFSKLPYDPETDLAAVTQLVTQPSALVVPAGLGVNTVQDLLALIKKEPAKFPFGSIGNGSLSHLAMEALAQKAGVKLVHVPFSSSPNAATAVIRGDVQMACLPAASVTELAKAGQVKILAVSTAKRSTLLPDVPTLKESGLDVEADAWMGLIAPAKTPAAIIDKLNKHVVEIIHLPAVKEKLAGVVMEPVGSSPEDFRKRIRAEIGIWEPVVKAGNIKIN